MTVLSVTLPKDVAYTFTVPGEAEVTLTVTEGGPVHYSDSLTGPFGDLEGSLALGESLTFTRPATLKATVDSEVEIDYPVGEPPDGGAPPGPPADDTDT